MPVNRRHTILFIVLSLSYTLPYIQSVGMGVMFSCWFSAAAYARVCAWFFSIGGLGSLLGTAPLALLNSVLGWRVSFAIIALLTLFASLAVFAAVRDAPPQADTTALARHSSPPVSTGLLFRSLFHVAQQRDFWKLFIWYGCMSGMYYAFGYLWAGLYLEHFYGLSKAAIGGILAMGALGFVLGNPFLTWLCEKYTHSHRLVLGSAGLLGLAAVCPLLLYNTALSLPVLYGVMLALGMAANAPNAIGYAAARALFGSRMVGIVGGVLGFAAFVGGACLQLICGVLLHLGQAAGFAPAQAYALAFTPFVLCTLVGTVAGFSLTESYGKTALE